jgi:streptomycin 6-kinase
MSGAAKARWLAGFIGDTWRELDRPCSERVVERALGFAAAREAAFDPATAVLVHGDAHSGNLLQSPADPATFKLIDPDGLFAEPACDLAIPMRGWNTPLLAGDTRTLARARCAYLGDLTGVDRRAIWEWGFVERVSTGLLLTRIGAEPAGRQTLEVAERFCRPP